MDLSSGTAGRFIRRDPVWARLAHPATNKSELDHKSLIFISSHRPTVVSALVGFPFGAVGVVAIGVLGLGLAILGWGGLVFRIAFAQKVEEVTADVAVLSLGGALAMDSGEAIEEELRDLGKGQGVAVLLLLHKPCDFRNG